MSLPRVKSSLSPLCQGEDYQSPVSPPPFPDGFSPASVYLCTEGPLLGEYRHRWFIKSVLTCWLLRSSCCHQCTLKCWVDSFSSLRNFSHNNNRVLLFFHINMKLHPKVIFPLSVFVLFSLSRTCLILILVGFSLKPCTLNSRQGKHNISELSIYLTGTSQEMFTWLNLYLYISKHYQRHG